MNPLRQARESLGLRVKDVADQTGIDQALVCKFESGQRIPTAKQADALAKLLSMDATTLQVYCLARRILALTGTGELALQAIRAAEAELSGTDKKEEIAVDEILQEMEVLKSMLLRKNALKRG